MTETEEGETASPDAAEEADPIPEWDDEYLDTVAARLAGHYDLERDRTVQGERFDLYGLLLVESQKQFFHESVNWANYETREHVFARRAEGVRVADLDRLVDLGHDLADAWIDADEEHQGTEFSFVLVVPEIPDAVREYVEGFRERTLLRYGYHGHYEVHLAVVSPDREDAVASREADVARAFAPWADLDSGGGLLSRLLGGLRG